MNEEKSSRYHRLKRRTAILSVVLTAAWLVAFLASGGSARLRSLAAAFAASGDPAAASTVAIYVGLLALVQYVLEFPLAWYRGFVLEHRYGLSTESFRTWMFDQTKAALVGLVLASCGAQVIYVALRVWPRGWWVASSIAFISAQVVIARLAPIVLLPLFYRFRPLERESLRARLIELSTRAGVPVLGVYEWGLGDKTRRANAALVGTGRTRRVLLSDTLLAEYTDDEIEVILAHELGHHAHHDIAKGLALESALITGGFFACAQTLDLVWRRLGLASPSDVAGLPVLLLVAGALSLVATPFANAWSRTNEKRADRFALAMTRRPAAFVSAMRRLAVQNLAEPHPSAAALWLFHTHPPIEQRIEAAKSAMVTRTGS
jgi:STE24 endopeptidase